MIYSDEEIKSMGFENADAFVKDYVSKHRNCYIRFVSGGVVCDYDFDSQLGLSWGGTYGGTVE